MIAAVPVAAPVTSPVVAFTDAIAALLLIHVPLVVALVRVTTAPRHTDTGPDIAGRAALTVTGTSDLQPAVRV